MANKISLLILLLISYSNCDQKIPNVENLGALFDTIKDAGLMDKFEEKFAELLADKKIVESNSDNDKNDFDLYEFCKEYSMDKFKVYNEKAIFYLSKIEVNLNDHVSIVKLTSVLDSLGDLTTSKQVINNRQIRFNFKWKWSLFNKLTNITKLNLQKSLDDKAIEIIKRTKTLQVLKVSLDKLLAENQDIHPKKSETQRTRAKLIRKSSESVDDTSSTDDPRKLMKNLPIELRKYIEQIREDPTWLVDFATSTLSSYELVSDKTVQMLEMYAKLFTQTEYFQYLLDMVRYF